MAYSFLGLRPHPVIVMVAMVVTIDRKKIHLYLVSTTVISMKEGIQIYYNDQLGGRSPKISDAIGNF